MSPFQCLRVQQGSEAMFEGQISGVPAPSVQWTWRGHPLEAGARAKTWYDEHTGRVCLVIPDLGPGDEGDYMCRADNPYGDSTCTITVSHYGNLEKIAACLTTSRLTNFKIYIGCLFMSSIYVNMYVCNMTSFHR